MQILNLAQLKSYNYKLLMIYFGRMFIIKIKTEWLIRVGHIVVTEYTSSEIIA